MQCMNGSADIDTTRFQRAAPVRSNGTRIAAMVENRRNAPLEEFREIQATAGVNKYGALASAIRYGGLTRLVGMEERLIRPANIDATRKTRDTDSLEGLRRSCAAERRNAVVRGASCPLQRSRRHVEPLRPTSRPTEHGEEIEGTDPASANRGGRTNETASHSFVTVPKKDERGSGRAARENPSAQ